MLKVLAAANIALLAKDHLMRLDAPERRRLIELVRIGRGRRRNLSESEREELAGLVAKMEPVETARCFIALLYLAMKGKVDLEQQDDSDDVRITAKAVTAK